MISFSKIKVMACNINSNILTDGTTVMTDNDQSTDKYLGLLGVK